MNTHNVKINGISSLAVVIGIILAAPSTAIAGSDVYEEKHWKIYKEVNDVALDSMRGRFMSGNQILFFGVEMYTEWKTSLGDTHVAALNIGVNRNVGLVRPTVTLVSRTGSTSQGSSSTTSGGGNTTQISSGGFDQVQGVGQVIQVTGNYNGISNAIGVDVSTERPQVYGANSSGSGNSQSFDTASGTSTSTYVMNNNAGVSVVVPGQGMASQTITDMIGMQQKAQVYGDLNHINNRLNLTVQLQSMVQNPVMTLNTALQNMRGLSVVGMF